MSQTLYVLHYAISLALLTWTHDLRIFFIYMLFCICIYALVSYIRNRLVYRPSLIVLSSISFLTLASVWIYQQAYVSQIHANTQHEQSYIASGVIDQVYGYGRYIFHDQYGAKYMIYTQDDTLIPGQELFVSAYFSPAYTASLWSQPSFQSLSEFDFSKRLMMKWLAGSLYSPQFVTLGYQDMSRVSKLRQSLLQRISSQFNPQTAALTAWLLIGDRSMMTDQDYDMFIDSGLVHIIAVSGGNIVMIVIFLSAILFRVPFYLRTFIILCAIIAYGIICGLESSVLRAVIMGSLSLLALFRWRQSYIRRSLLIAFFFMTLINPYVLLYDIGFIFSFAAVIGIVYISQRYTSYISKRSQTKAKNTSSLARPSKYNNIYIKCSTILMSYLIPTIGATIGVLPFLLLFTQSYNITSIIANILVAPVIPLLMIRGIISTILYSIVQWDIIIRIQDFLIQYIYSIAQYTARRGVYITLVQQHFAYLRTFLILLWFIHDRIYSTHIQTDANHPDLTITPRW